jgi:hypothetical protein
MITIGQNDMTAIGDYTTSFSVSKYQVNKKIRISFNYRMPAVYRIWLS